MNTYRTNEITDLHAHVSENGDVIYAPSTGSLGCLPACLPVILGAVSAIKSLVKAIKNGKQQRDQLVKQKGLVDQAITQLKDENSQLDAKIKDAKNLIEQVTGQKLSGLAGLGLCIIGCKAKAAAKALNSAVQNYDLLQDEQNQKLALLDSLQKTLESFESQKDTTKIGLIVGGGILLLTGLFIMLK